MRRSHPAPHGPPASLKEISCAVSFQRFSSRPLSPFCPWRCSRRARRRRRGRNLPSPPSTATSLPRTRALHGRPFEIFPAEGVTATLIDMTSQRWLTEKEVERPLWTHWLTVIRPQTVTSDIAFLYITGGSLDRDPPAKPPAWLVDAARDTGTVTAELRLVPNQPVVFTDDPTHAGRSEDDFIAYTWNQFLRTGDERWPARLPMTKSAVRAMDAVTAFTNSPAGGGHAADPVRRLRRVEARMDDMGDCRGRFAGDCDCAGGHRSAQHRTIVQASLPGIRRVVRRGAGLRRPGNHEMARHAPVQGAHADRRAVRVPGQVDDAEVHHECIGGSVLPAGFVAVLLRPVTGREAPALRAERVAFARQDRRARERGGVLCVDRERDAASGHQLDVRAGRLDQGHCQRPPQRGPDVAGVESRTPATSVRT